MKKNRMLYSNRNSTNDFNSNKCRHFLSRCRFALLILLFSVLSFKAIANGACKPSVGNGTELCSVEIQYSGQTRMYQYEIRRPHPGSPTVIEIPGGPGQGYIGAMNSVAASAVIPDGFGIISINPRGVGTNDYGADLIGGNYTSDLEVSDILTIIKAELLDNYLIHGQSYGTLVATKLASKISGDSEVAKPKGIILSGVVNEFYEDQLAAYNFQIERALNAFGVREKDKIASGLKNIMKDIFLENENVFAGAMMNALLFNTEATNSPFGVYAPNFKKFLDMLATGNRDETNPLYSQLIAFAKANATKKFNFSEVKRKNTMAEAIKCTEMSKLGFESDISFNFEKIQFVLLHSDCEKKGYSVTNPYHSKNYQIIDIPIYYFQGSIDPATPATDAKAHYVSQQHTAKVYVELTGYSHTNLIGISNCQAGLWTALSHGPNQLSNVIAKCEDPNVRILQF